TRERKSLTDIESFTTFAALPAPVPEYNFAATPQVSARDELWIRKHPHLAAGAPPKAEDRPDETIVLPGGTYMPLLVSLGLFVAGYGLLYSLPVFWGGIAVALLALAGWGLEGDNERIIRLGGKR
ncbi:MAG: hypothetical protein LOD91_04760, partial [Limnochordales bacterium]